MVEDGEEGSQRLETDAMRGDDNREYDPAAHEEETNNAYKKELEKLDTYNSDGSLKK